MNEKVALITGISMGLGHALAGELATHGWRVVGDARDAARLRRAVKSLPTPRSVVAIAGDVADPTHRQKLADAVAAEGRLDLIVNNASTLGPSPQPPLAGYPVADLERVLAVNAVAPLALLQLVMAMLIRGDGRVINISSDAAVEAYAGWGGYGSAKAALDQLTAVLAVEQPGLRVYAFDPGDMDTDLHRQAEPGEDLSGVPSPVEVVPALMRLVTGDEPSGRYRVSDLSAVTG
jgi:NAD(P)-dependent dehydrogenase (short-subunit alcohol dehydrogenase family)